MAVLYTCIHANVAWCYFYMYAHEAYAGIGLFPLDICSEQPYHLAGNGSVRVHVHARVNLQWPRSIIQIKGNFYRRCHQQRHRPRHNKGHLLLET